MIANIQKEAVDISFPEYACLIASVGVAVIILSLDAPSVAAIVMGMVVGIGGVVHIYYMRRFKNFGRWLEERSDG